ncbi:MAG: TetR/AcrR family transcriptional regulator [Pseudopedobacter saltans]|uniref:TetR/AcrR family transcriptional regulator n=1 Tax=Pseudopedobacter saltans TaxID=151895 RepID=A0A2W5GKY0_9SPHI|nr:MAG: TetR/AcrR family transcriptional regulator [Pseudopedobacter saltans]
MFNKKGYVGTYLSDLTEATGLTKGSIYGNFKDKNEVAVEAFRYNYDFQTRNLFPTIDNDNPGLEGLIESLNLFKTVYETIFNNGGCTILNTAVDADDGNDVLKSEVIQSIYKWKDTIATMLTNAIRNNEIPKIDVDVLSYRIIALVEGSLMLAKTLNRPEILISNIDSLIKEVSILEKQ